MDQKYYIIEEIDSAQAVISQRAYKWTSAMRQLLARCKGKQYTRISTGVVFSDTHQMYLQEKETVHA